MHVFCTNFLRKSKNGHFFVLFRKFLKSLYKNVTFVTDSSQNLFDSKIFCDHKKNFKNNDFEKNKFRSFFVSII